MVTLGPTLAASNEDLVGAFGALTNDTDVARLLEVPIEQLRHILYERRTAFPYRVFQVAKRNGGHRPIAAPHPTVKILQQKLLRVLTLVSRPRPAAHGFTLGRDIRTNSSPHVAKTWVLNIDLTDFFTAIHFGRVMGVLTSPAYRVGRPAAALLAQLCCYDGVYPGGSRLADGSVRGFLPQGSPTSPILSNMICHRLDRELQELARDHGCFYTRYADDITFSTQARAFPASLASRRSPRQTAAVVGESLQNVVSSNGFEVNATKVRIQRNNEHQSVTGLTVNRAPNLGRGYIRSVRAMIDDARMNGIAAAEGELRTKYYSRSRNPAFSPPSFVRVLRGRLDFIKMVKGERDPAYQSLLHEGIRLEGCFKTLPPHVFAEPDPALTVSRPWGQWVDRYTASLYHIEVRRDGNVLGGTGFAIARDVLATAAHNLIKDDGRIAGTDSFDCSPAMARTLTRDLRARIGHSYGASSNLLDVALVLVQPEDAETPPAPAHSNGARGAGRRIGGPRVPRDWPRAHSLRSALQGRSYCQGSRRRCRSHPLRRTGRRRCQRWSANRRAWVGGRSCRTRNV
jgi:RNA-directed DNA polymerase